MKINRRDCPRCGAALTYADLTVCGDHLVADLTCESCGYQAHVDEHGDADASARAEPIGAEDA